MKKCLFPLLIALPAALTTPAAWSETTVKILHLQNIPEFIGLWKEIGSDFEKQNPGVKIDWQYLENEAFKAKLPTMLQSDERPDLFYSWAGGVFYDQAEAGVLRDITDFMRGEWEESLSPAGVAAFTYEDRIYGAPMKAAPEIIWYYKALVDKAGIDPQELTQWDSFLEAVKKCKDAGITPIAAGGADKWPLHFYWTMLALRLGGEEAFKSAYNRSGEGFDSPVFVKAGEMFQELLELEPFQRGFLGATYTDASGYFGDGKACMHFMGDWDYTTHKNSSQSGKGIPDEQLGYVRFPAVEGGKGNDAVLGAVEGWLVAKGAPDEAVQFLRFFTNKENQTKMAAAGVHIPLTKGAEEALENPFFRQFAQDINTTPYLQIVYDQFLGANVGRVVNDISADLAAGAITPEEAAQTLQEAWELEQ
ncbi:MAG: extracellular solute-binding protein [Pseudomonadota bacterium]|nr:extracellular solute-binding protein [Pseudomonadota bacterium]